MKLSVSSHGHQYEVDIASESTLAELKCHLQSLTGIQDDDQKLIYKASSQRLGSGDSELTLAAAGLVDGMKIMLLGPVAEEKIAVEKGDRRLAILKKRATASTPVARAAGKAFNNLDSRSNCFGRIEALQHPVIDALGKTSLSSQAAVVFLERLAADPAIKGLMTKHDLSANLLTELPPLPDDPETSGRLLGLNKTDQNGRTILLRIRTDDLEGWRHYRGVRETLVHELVHNSIGPHNDQFHALNRSYLLEVEAFDKAEKQAAIQRIGGAQAGSQWSESNVVDRYDPVSRSSHGQEHLHKLGSSSKLEDTIDDPQARREKIREAAEGRISRQEKETVLHCGTAPPDETSKR